MIYNDHIDDMFPKYTQTNATCGVGFAYHSGVIEISTGVQWRSCCSFYCFSVLIFSTVACLLVDVVSVFTTIYFAF